ncbi:MAG: type transport system permease protein [Thermoleophilaceae bacterium]|nr:type transport system permease protein [Thermoleophilaceae bacterium]
MSSLTNAGLLVRRSVNRTLRQPANLVFSFVFPMILLAVNAGGLSSATKIPGFPVDSYLTFALAVPVIQGALFASNSAGTNIAEDIESGFLSRLSLTPLTRGGLLVGQLAGVVALGLGQACVYLAVGEAAGAGFKAGLLGVPVLLALSLLVTLGFGSIGAFAALRTGSGEAVQGLFPLMFVLLFLSSNALPRNLIETDWFRTIATYNPVSYLLEAIRSLLITGWDAKALALGFGCAIGIAAIGVWASSRALRSRMLRT